ncbi:hypothetical protein [Qingshengfaniella alkalisoli]|uniref:Uncharacterized protein n=1 Tax=Qingshengfaniella alkalisoli TaxID=2599296 RepID=A0A5B8I864_9RHOB|nr:hypothetical protein [Qingshengfaniella alkalisoli]QDY70125.1 hypothetical protein FPZ52_11165 [Qingshengfaniella alkalisoli]
MANAVHPDRIRFRHAHEAGAGAGHDWAGEAFNFTAEEYELITKLHPELRDGSPQDQRRAWIRFGQTSVGQAFRVR